MNTEIIVSFGPVSLIALVIQQIFVIYAVYAIFFRSNDKYSSRAKMLNILKNYYAHGEINAEAYRKLEKDLTNL